MAWSRNTLMGAVATWPTTLEMGVHHYEMRHYRSDHQVTVVATIFLASFGRSIH